MGLGQGVVLGWEYSGRQELWWKCDFLSGDTRAVQIRGKGCFQWGDSQHIRWWNLPPRVAGIRHTWYIGTKDSGRHSHPRHPQLSLEARVFWQCMFPYRNPFNLFLMQVRGPRIDKVRLLLHNLLRPALLLIVFIYPFWSCGFSVFWKILFAKDQMSLFVLSPMSNNFIPK